MGHLLRNTTTIFITLRPPDQEETTPAEIIKHLQHIRRQAFWRDNVPGGTWALEAATDGHRLYWHLHIIAEYRYFVGMPIWDFSNELLRAWGARSERGATRVLVIPLTGVVVCIIRNILTRPHPRLAGPARAKVIY
jgi:hypothetical protein